jgi:hypothetical protein
LIDTFDERRKSNGYLKYDKYRQEGSKTKQNKKRKYKPKNKRKRKDEQQNKHKVI